MKNKRKVLSITVIAIVIFIFMMFLPYIVGGITFGFDMFTIVLWMLGILELIAAALIGILCWFLSMIIYKNFLE